MSSNWLKKVPEMPPKIPKTPESILEKTKSLIKQWHQAQDQIVRNIQPENATFVNTVLPLADIENSVNLHAPILTFYEVTSTHLDIGKASSEARKLLDDFRSKSGKNQALYDLVHAVWGKAEDVDAESHRLLEIMYQSFGKNGLRVPEGPGRHRLKDIEERINQLAIEFRKSRSNENGSIWFTLQELDGAPHDVLSRLENGQGDNKGRVRVYFNNPDHCSIFSYVKSAEVRKRFAIANSNKCFLNVALLKDVVVLRDEAARLLGYDSHAALRLENRMARNPKIVNAFLNDLQSRLVLNGKIELERLKKLKKTEIESRGEAFDGKFYPWEYGFYNRLIVKKRHSIDREKVAGYFPVQTTIQGMLKNFEHLFALQFCEVSGDDVVWDQEVQLYSVWDEETRGSGFLGYLYLDLFAREGKDAGAFNYTLQPGFSRNDGTRQFPSTALFCSFTKPSPTKPCLLYHYDLVTLFHELGHGIHNLVSKTKYSRFHGTNTPLDFGEAPSQMLEHWCWTPSFLKFLGRHYSYISPDYLELWKEKSNGELQPPAQLPDEMIEGIIGSRYTSNAIFLLGQVQLSMFDMKIHQPVSHEAIQNLDLAKEYNDLVREVQLFDVPDLRDEWSSMFVVFGHLMDEYDAGYYSYLFSQVYSTDMFYSIFKQDPRSQKEGRRYCELVLKKGGSQDELKSLRDFLGRDPNVEAFYKDLGLEEVRKDDDSSGFKSPQPLHNFPI